jgi:hypothetical protein
MFDFNKVVNYKFSVYITSAQNSLQLFGYNGKLLMTASVALVDEKLGQNEIAIKDYAENAGVLDFLIKKNIVSEPVRTVQTGYVLVPICNILKK